jgi:ubiquinone/menaquinone biosynthesis C-methylase UbiE
MIRRGRFKEVQKMSLSPSLNFSSLADMYERVLVEPLFRPWVDDLLDRVKPVAGDRVLDVACGTGIVARVAKERLGRDAVVVGIDASEQMLAVARRVAPDVEWRQGNAIALPLGPGEQFDVLTCQQGVQFFPDKPAAAREMRRALASGGRLAIATWRPVEESPLFKALHELSERHLGPVVDQRHAFGIATQLESLLQDAGFRDVRVETVTRTIHLRDTAVFLQMNANAIVGMSPAARALDDAERGRLAAAIAADSQQLATHYDDGAGLVFDLGTNVATATV